MNTPHFSQRLFAALIVTAGSSLLPLSSYATSDIWTGTTSTAWATSSNWSTSPTIVPGTGDTATFNGAGNGNTIIDLGSGVTIDTVIFDTATAAAYTIGSGGTGGQTLTLNDSGAVTMNATVVNNQLFNANIVLGTDAGTGTTTITNNSTTNSLTFAGSITGGTAATETVNIVGAGAVNFTGPFGPGGSTGVNLANTGNGTMTLSGSGTSNLLMLRATGGTGSEVVVNGQTVNVSNNSTYTGTSGFKLQSGSLNFNGGLSQTSVSADAGLWEVSGGAFSASSVTIGRNGNPTASAAVSSTVGLVVTGGTANITGIFALGTNNSGSTSLVNGGALTVGGKILIGAGTSSTRWNILEVRSGSLTSTDTTNGIVLSGAGTAVQNSQLLLTGGTTTAEKITFGTASTFAGSTGSVLINGSGASLYLGTGGIVNGGGSNITPTITLSSGTLGAKADWSSSLAMNLNGLANGSAVTIKAADASNIAYNIALSGALSGTGGFTKTGAGMLTLSGGNSYTGATIINGGTLALGVSNALATSTAITLGGGTLNLGGLSQAAFTSALTMTASSTIDFGSHVGSLTLTFGDSHGMAWTGTLTLLNFTVGTDNLNLTSVSGLTLEQLSQISLAGYTATGLDSSGNVQFTVSAIPEPATYAALVGLGILGFTAYRRRHA